ncbi:MAG: hypothetical protein HY690_01350 [Chloroflexi bacterium]|nr:hypothetical protein [Chloroflexota bacterium]
MMLVDRLKLLSMATLIPLVFAACTTPAAQPTAPAGQPAAPAVQPTLPAPPPQPTTQAAQPTVTTATETKLGTMLTDARGMALYLYTRDEPNVSTCYDQCAQNWPPLLATSGDPTAAAGLSGTLGTTVRKDGTRQVTYNGIPLYYWFKDAKPGDTTGQGVGNVWFVVPPAAAGFPTVKTTADKELGTILTDLKGMTLYRFTRDEPNVSTCYDQCAQNWPPLLATAGDPMLAGGVPGQLGTVARKDGTKQVTYNGTALYYWAKDTKPGETTGQAVNNVWFVVQPAAPQAASTGQPGY